MGHVSVASRMTNQAGLCLLVSAWPDRSALLLTRSGPATRTSTGPHAVPDQQFPWSSDLCNNTSTTTLNRAIYYTFFFSSFVFFSCVFLRFVAFLHSNCIYMYIPFFFYMERKKKMGQYHPTGRRNVSSRRQQQTPPFWRIPAPIFSSSRGS